MKSGMESNLSTEHVYCRRRRISLLSLEQIMMNCSYDELTKLRKIHPTVNTLLKLHRFRYPRRPLEVTVRQDWYTGDAADVHFKDTNKMELLGSVASQGIIPRYGLHAYKEVVPQEMIVLLGENQKFSMETTAELFPNRWYKDVETMFMCSKSFVYAHDATCFIRSFGKLKTLEIKGRFEFSHLSVIIEQLDKIESLIIAQYPRPVEAEDSVGREMIQNANNEAEDFLHAEARQRVEDGVDHAVEHDADHQDGNNDIIKIEASNECMVELTRKAMKLRSFQLRYCDFIFSKETFIDFLMITDFGTIVSIELSRFVDDAEELEQWMEQNTDNLFKTYTKGEPREAYLPTSYDFVYRERHFRLKFNEERRRRTDDIRRRNIVD